MLSYYQILQVKETATDAEIKQAYRGLVKILHPDLNNNTAEATAIFRLLNQAYETLSDPLERKAYDRKPDPNASADERVESYKTQNAKQAQKLKEYEDMLTDYKQTVFLKSKRERELTNEIDDLKKRNIESERNLAAKSKSQEESVIQEELIPQSETETNWLRIILLIIGVNIIMFLSYFACEKVFWIFFK